MFVRVLMVACLLVVAGSLQAQTKRDILGFTTGMTQKQLQAHKYSCSTLYTCKVRDGEIHFRFQNDIKPGLATVLQYEFESGTGPDEMIDMVSKQFDRPSIKTSKGGWISDEQIHVGMSSFESKYRLVSRWDLEAGLKLALGFSDRRMPYRYVLQLQDEELVALDRLAAHENAAAEEAKRKAKNLTPKF